jgi:hypothetical protein
VVGSRPEDGRVVEITQPDRSGQGQETIALPVMDDVQRAGLNYIIAPDGSVHRVDIFTSSSSGSYMTIDNASVQEDGVSRWQLDPRLDKEDVIKVHLDDQNANHNDGSYELPGGGKVVFSLKRCDRTNVAETTRLGALMVDTLVSRAKLVTGQPVK